MRQARVRSRLSRLFFFQVCLLAAAAGVLAWRHPGPGCVFLGLLWLLDLPRSARAGRVAALVLAFAAGVGYTAFREPSPPPEPEWLAKITASARPPAVRIRGLVCAVTPLAGDRLRLILEDVVPAGAFPGPDGAPYRGRIVWTVRHPAFTPLPGRVLEATVRLSPLHGMRNPGLWDADRYWQDRHVWLRARSGANAGARLLDPGEEDAPSGSPLTAAFAGARQALLAKFLAALPGETPADQSPGPVLAGAAALLPALIFGDRSMLSAEQSDLFSRSTLMHSLALSGLHLGYAALLGLAAARGIGRCFPGLWLFMPRPAAAMLLALPLAAIYLWLGNMPLSLARAAAMLLVCALFMLRARPRVPLDILLAAVAMLLALDPLFLFELSLQLSALSVAVIALCLPFLSGLARRLFPHRPRFALWRRCARGVVLLLGMSFCIQTALLPITLRAFGSVGLSFPLNAIWLPLLGAAVMPAACLGLVFAGLGLETPAGLALHLACLPCDALMQCLRALDSAGLLPAPLLPRPHWLSVAGFWLLCLSVPGALRGRAGGAFRGALLFSLLGTGLLALPPAWVWHADQRREVRLRLVDVGQGQAVLLEWSGLGAAGAAAPPAGRALIDGGGFALESFDVGRSVIAPILTDNALPHLDMVINSHPDADHLGGLLYVLEHFSVGQYLSNGAPAAPALAAREQGALRRSGLARRALVAGDRILLAPELHLETLWPEAARAGDGESGNNASLILRLVWRDRGLALLCGDAEVPALRRLMAANREAGDDHSSEGAVANGTGGRLRAQALVLPHHGSSGALLAGFYEAVRPQVALAACGYANQWGFPSPTVQDALQKLRIPLYDTARYGQILLRWRDPDAPPELIPAREDESG
jgi:competence protein ComEC